MERGLNSRRERTPVGRTFQGVRNFAEMLALDGTGKTKSSRVNVCSATCVAEGDLDDLFCQYGRELEIGGWASVDAVFDVTSGCGLFGSPMIRDDGLAYVRKPDGQPYSPRRIQQWMSQADFFIWRARIPATVQSSWHTYLDGCIDDASRGRIERTAKVNIITPPPSGGSNASDVAEIPGK